MSENGWLPSELLGKTLRWFDLRGPDAADFLKRLSTVDPDRIEIGSGTSCAFLAPSGKFESFFILWKLDDEAFGLEFDDPSGEQSSRLLHFVNRFTFGEKLALTTLSSEQFEGRIFMGERAPLPSAAPLRPYQTQALEPGIRIQHWGTKWFGVQTWSIWARPGAIEFVSEIEPDLKSRRIAAMCSWWDEEINPSTSPLEVGRADAIHSGKGCYPGQEVVERIWALGSPATRLVQVEWEQDVVVITGTKLFNRATPPQSIGTVTTHAGSKSLAIVRKLHAIAGIEVGDPEGKHGRIRQVADFQPIPETFPS